MKTYNNITKQFEFKCDICRFLISENRDEGKALSIARYIAEREGWKWFHPHWGLVCPDCKRKESRIVPLSGGWQCLVCGSYNGSFEHICKGCKRDLEKEGFFGWKIKCISDEEFEGEFNPINT